MDEDDQKLLFAGLRELQLSYRIGDGRVMFLGRAGLLRGSPGLLFVEPRERTPSMYSCVVDATVSATVFDRFLDGVGLPAEREYTHATDGTGFYCRVAVNETHRTLELLFDVKYST